MANRLISLAAGTLRTVEPGEMIVAAARAGFDAVGFGFEHRQLTPRELVGLSRRLEDESISVIDIEVVRIAPNDDNEAARRLIDYGAALGARHLLVVSNDDDEERTADRFAEICAMASEVGIRPVLEFMAFTSVTSLASAVRIVERSGAAEGGVLIDSLHLARCGDSAKDIASFRQDLFPYAQICDAPARAPSTRELLADEARHNRLEPGDGDLALAELLFALSSATPLSIEVLSDSLDDLPPLARALSAMAAARALLESIGEITVFAR
ncbi:MAG TPA: sugar phosphate isomerase/epimerase [Acidimicrobiales bacterium]|nr:sugar phosphate isomerase/epimerase [Acidimicrobiales bacterium]